MSNNDNGSLGRAFAPGQREEVKRDVRSELRLPLQQGRWLLVIGLLVFGVAMVDLLIVGPLAGFLAVLMAALAISAYALWLARQREDGGMILGAILLGVTLVTAWLATGWEITEAYWPPIRIYWPLWAKVTALGASFVVLTVLALLGYRFAYEVVDPNWPPTKMQIPAEYGPAWPWTPWDRGVPEVEVLERVVSRPVPVSGNNTISSPQQAGGDGRVFTESRTLIAPSGNEVPVTAVAEFVHKMNHIGADFRAWKRRGWKYDLWRDVVDLAAMFGAVSKREGRTKTRVLTDDEAKVLERVRAALE